MKELWYAHPAVQWNEALPLGNGRVGAMVFGGALIERIAMNEDSLWYGGFRDGLPIMLPPHQKYRSILT